PPPARAPTATRTASTSLARPTRSTGGSPAKRRTTHAAIRPGNGCAPSTVSSPASTPAAVHSSPWRARIEKDARAGHGSAVSKETLRRNLERLRAELATGEDLDPELLSLLNRVAEEIEQVLEDEQMRPKTLRDRVEKATAQFEAQHPRLAPILGDLADALAKVGL